MAALILLSACAPVPKLGGMHAVAPADRFVSARSLSPLAPAVWPQSEWWVAYGDAQLDALIAEALIGSPDLAAAGARVRQADAYSQQVGAARLPAIEVEGGASATKQSYRNGIPPSLVPHGWNVGGRLKADLGFDLDLWGANRAAHAAAHSEADAARLDYAQAALVLSTTIADAYADLSRLFAERAVAMTALDVRRQTWRLTSDRVASGLDTQAELRQAQAAVPAARAEIAATDERIGLARNRLAALLGQGPDRGLGITRPAASVVPRDVPGDATTDLIGRRPDIVAARSRVEAAASRIKVARAAFYPSINLTAVLGFESLGLSNLLAGRSGFGDVAPAISLPIFRRGALKGRYRGARAAYEAAVADYDRVVAEAYRAVADAVVSQRALRARLAESRQALANYNGAYAVATQRYEGGLSTFLDVLNAQDRSLQALATVTDLEARAFTLDVALVRALGGGFAEAAPRTGRKDNG